MAISLENYEAYFLDYLEQRLSAADERELMAFLEKYPDLRSELEEMEMLTLPAEEAKAVDFSFLKKDEETGLSQEDSLIIGGVEQVLNKEEEQALSQLLAEDDKAAASYAVYQKTILQPNPQEVYGDVSALKRSRAKVLLLYRSAASVAAAAAILLFFFLRTGNEVDGIYQSRGLANLPSGEELFEESTYWVGSEEKPSASTSFAKLDANPTPKKSAKPSKTNSNLNPKPVVPVEQKEDVPSQFAELKKEENAPSKKETVDDGTVTHPVEPQPMPKEEIARVEVAKEELPADATDEEFVTLPELASNVIDRKVLKGKNFSETLASATNGKVNYEREKDTKGETKSLALSIGKFSFSRKKGN